MVYQTIDVTLNEIAKHIDLVDYRDISNKKVGISLLANELTKSRAADYKEGVETYLDKKTKKIENVMEAQNELLEKAKVADAAAIENLEMKDDVMFTEVKVALYQDEKILTQKFAILKNIQPYKDGFMMKAATALVGGMGILENLVLITLRMWSILLLAVGAWFLYGRIRKKLSV